MFLKGKTRRTAEYQQMLRKGLRIKEICKNSSIINTDRVHIYPEGIVEVFPMQTGNWQDKKQRSYNPRMLEFVADIDKYCGTNLEREIMEYVNLNRSNNIQERDALGERLMTALFGNSYKEFLSLTCYDVVDIVFDCIDYDDSRQEKYRLHFRFYECLKIPRIFKNNANKIVELLQADIENDNYKILNTETA